MASADIFSAKAVVISLRRMSGWSQLMNLTAIRKRLLREAGELRADVPQLCGQTAVAGR